MLTQRQRPSHLFCTAIGPVCTFLQSQASPLQRETGPGSTQLLVAPCKAVEEAPRLLSLHFYRAIPQARHLDLLFAQAVYKEQHRVWTHTTRPLNLVC